ncbi:MAG: hypothetical protein IKB54_04810, partial [Clostridia bacterium]|nr:hypothetical protein [Clostridia bacterium]
LTITTTGVLAGDTLDYTFDHNYVAGATGVGSVDVTVTLGENPNYNVTTNGGTLTVTARPVTITANNAVVVYGNAAPEFTESVSGAVNGYPVNYSLSSDYTVGANAGTTHAIIVTLGSNPNYNVTTNSGTLTVVKANYVGITHPAVDGGVYNPNKTLADHALNANFSWVDSTITPTVGNAGYQVVYNADPTNYNDLFLSSVKVNLTKAPVVIGGSTTQTIDYTAGAPYTFNQQALTVSYNGTQLVGVFEFTGVSSYTVASTYQFTAVLSHQNYEGSVLCTFIIKSVDVGGTLYTIEDALNVATSGNVIVKYNTAFSNVVGYYNGSQYYTVKSGVTLLLPFEAADTVGWLGAGKEGSTNFDRLPEYSPSQNASVPKASLYVSLDVPSSVSISVSGTVVVGAFIGSKAGGTNMNEVSGGYGQINLYGNMTLNNATLRVMGYIVGTGTITANNSTVIENMFLVGWTGGTVATAKYSGGCNALSVYTSPNSVNNNPKVFPFSQYELRSIQTKLVINYGSKLQGYAKVTTGALSVSFITIDAQVNESYIDLITSSSSANGGLIRMTASGSSVIKTFANGRVALRLNGTFSDGCLAMNLTVLGKTASLSTEKVFFAIDGRVDVTLTSGSTLTQSNKLKFMPGATVTIENGATYTLNGSSIFYTS